MRIGIVASKTGLNPKTIRYYEEIALLPRPRRGKNRYRSYGPEIIERLNFIKRAQALGFSLIEIKEIMAIYDGGGQPCDHIYQLLKKKVREMFKLCQELQAVLDDWGRGRRPKSGVKGTICPEIVGG